MFDEGDEADREPLIMREKPVRFDECVYIPVEPVNGFLINIAGYYLQQYLFVMQVITLSLEKDWPKRLIYLYSM